MQTQQSSKPRKSKTEVTFKTLEEGMRCKMTLEIDNIEIGPSLLEALESEARIRHLSVDEYLGVVIRTHFRELAAKQKVKCLKRA